jgi:hypothetical protein
MSKRALIITASACLLAAVLPAKAHHTFVQKYDASKLVTVSGTIGSVSFSNPHIFFSVGGWRIETESISVANARGLTKERLKEGAKVTVRGWKARDGSSAMGLHAITFSGGPSVTMRGSAR